MKKLLYHIFLLLCSTGLFGQATISLNSPRTAGGTETACQSITLKPGFSFKATNTANGSLTLRVNPSTCDPFAGQASSASSNQNYIRTRTYTTDNGSRYMEAIRYFDGLGRPVQTVQRGITPNTADLVTLQEYDAFGRESNSWLPAVIANNNGAYVTPSTIKTGAVGSNGNDQKPYSLPVYEASPLNRILQQYGPGTAWHGDYTAAKGKAVKTDYLTNGTDPVDNGALSCRKYAVSGSGLTTKLTYSGGGYEAAQLYVTRMTDEDGNRVYEFKDKLGQVLLTRAINVLPDKTIQHLNTLYVYDDFGNLCYV
ncbi:MAG: DUF6443 domain-containing protein, partial [Prevotella sp.]|nr:DUF6443 domain-containing protein [Prevotella sp.]